MYEVSKFKDAGGGSYMMVRISRAEALALIQSLARQIEEGDPNSGRAEPRYKTADGKEGGFFSISVQEDLICAVCKKEYKPFTGTEIFDNVVICPDCASKKCPDKRCIGGLNVHSQWCAEDQRRRIEEAWASQKGGTKKGIAKKPKKK